MFTSTTMSLYIPSREWRDVFGGLVVIGIGEEWNGTARMEGDSCYGTQ